MNVTFGYSSMLLLVLLTCIAGEDDLECLDICVL
jgi:hypothetical protein